MTDTPQSLKVALLGAGNVGSQVARILTEDAAMLEARIGARLELVGVFVRNPDAPRDYQLPRELYTADAAQLVDRADIVIELLGGIEPAKTLIERAIANGSAVVTGNKALLAQSGSELFRAAADAGTQLSFEASVGGAIPILRPLRDSLSGDRVTRVMGIANGTTNYILDQMDTTGAAFADALAEAQRLGYAEADPTADVEGHDAAAKAAILANLAFHAPFSLDQVHCEGITSITAADNEAAAEAGHVIKLLAIAERIRTEDGTDGAVLRVHPTLLPREHPLAAVHGAYNAVFVEAENAGHLMFYGPGAGGAPTASAVMGDTVSIARRLVRGGAGRTHTPKAVLPALEVGEATTSYMIVLRVADQPGVLAAIATVVAEHGVSIEAMRQVPLAEDDAVYDAHEGTGVPASHEPAESLLRIITHRARERALASTVTAIKELDVVTDVVSVLRVEGN
ncbi:homoserine dehydrogenase [Citricoccus sp. SGAir0253]|uniref:homoserine dehydrogenase n=1 Tax=Citricoccus sp. SGAir0253 TaxID=2567881 RepID=UPI0010CD2F65|nr:homoserine dehydrogenase [Citricoccus sp. SGAir0253]QCU78426.1 homoserine dehydrogenase [Citricoccus sp. SGAir0253]